MSHQLRMEIEVLEPDQAPVHHRARWAERLQDGDGPAQGPRRPRGLGRGAPTKFYGETTETVLAALDTYGTACPTIRSILRRRSGAGSSSSAATRPRAALSSALARPRGQAAGRAGLPALGLDPTKAPRSTFTIGLDTPEKMRAKVREAEQYPILKIKLGTDRDVEILRTIRDATDREIRVDANCGWTLKQTVRMLPVLDEYGVTVLEQPLRPISLTASPRSGGAPTSR